MRSVTLHGFYSFEAFTLGLDTSVAVFCVSSAFAQSKGYETGSISPVQVQQLLNSNWTKIPL
jgi:hypothetical protein